MYINEERGKGRGNREMERKCEDLRKLRNLAENSLSMSNKQKNNSSKKPNFHLITCNLYLFDKEGIPEGISDFKSNYQQCFDC